MSITVQLDLPEDVATEARERGLLEPERLGRILDEAVRRERNKDSKLSLGDMMKKLRETSGEPMSLEEIQAIVDGVRAERLAREAGH
tara:strand:+ start:147 stop:407 length:261 start_codon:yes stop_codon:yes gene_type:complete